MSLTTRGEALAPTRLLSPSCAAGLCGPPVLVETRHLQTTPMLVKVLANPDGSPRFPHGGVAATQLSVWCATGATIGRMARFGSRVLPRSEATDLLADVSGCLADLGRAIVLLTAARERLPDNHSPNSAIGAGLAEAGIITYGRCFTTGRRARLGLDSVPEPARVAHELALALRNRFAAHSVNALEQNIVVVNPEEWPAVSAIRGMNFRLNLPRRVTEDVLFAAVVVRDGLQERIEAAKAAVYAELDQLDAAEFATLLTPRLDPVAFEDFDFERERSLGAGRGVVPVPVVVYRAGKASPDQG